MELATDGVAKEVIVLVPCCVNGIAIAAIEGIAVWGAAVKLYAVNSEGSITMVTMADLLFDWFGFDQTGKTVANST